MIMKIIGTGSCAGEQKVTNQDLEKIVETSDEWIRTRTGISSRYLSTKQGVAGMAAAAAEKACDQAGISPQQLDLILLATSTPQHCFPSAACEVQGKIGAEHAAAFDISAACSGFIFALHTAFQFIQSGACRNILVIGADELSKAVDWTDRKTCVLFGDGAGAVIVRGQNEGKFFSRIGSDGSRGEILTCTARSGGNFLTEKRPQIGFISMDGQEVFKFAVKKVPECILEISSEGNIPLDDIRYYLLHQANERIIEAVAKRLKEPIEKFPMNIESYGNTSAATIPILLDEMNRNGRLNQGDKLILAGFGGGLTWGAALLEW